MARETCGGRAGGVSQEEAAWNQETDEDDWMRENGRWRVGRREDG